MVASKNSPKNIAWTNQKGKMNIFDILKYENIDFSNQADVDTLPEELFEKLYGLMVATAGNASIAGFFPAIGRRERVVFWYNQYSKDQRLLLKAYYGKFLRDLVKYDI